LDRASRLPADARHYAPFRLAGDAAVAGRAGRRTAIILPRIAGIPAPCR
jgi:hypothetical protein